MRKLTIEEVRRMHTMLILETGGTDGVRDMGLIESAIYAPFQTFDGKDIYSMTEEKAARLGYSLVNNHGFVDGNKRIGVLAMLVFLELNGIELICSDDDLIQIGLGLADGTKDDKALLEWIKKHRK